MGNRILMIALLGLLCLPASGFSGDSASPQRVTLVLKNGNAVKGEVLREKTEGVVLDLGFAVLTVPGEAILKRVKDNGLAAKPAPEPNGIFREASPGALPERRVKDLTESLGESVVLVATPAGMGSGFFVDEAGHVVTNFHVIFGEQEVAVTIFRKRKGILDRQKIEKARIVAINPYLDLALLKIDMPDKEKSPALYLGDSEAIRNGQPAFAIGNPLGLERTVSEGIISTRRRSFGGQIYLQTTAPINPGNSGGPLFNLNGEVIGVTNMKAGFMSEGLSFAIPVDTLKFFLRNRDVFMFDKDNPNSGYHYLPPPGKRDAQGDGATSQP